MSKAIEVITEAKPHTIKKFELIEKYVDEWSRKILGYEGNEYLYYVLLSNVFWKYYKKVSSGSIMASISQEKLGNFSFPIYNIGEQNQIVDYLDDKCAKIDKLIEIKQSKIAKLNEYKKSLIYEYVTGKKEVC